MANTKINTNDKALEQGKKARATKKELEKSTSKKDIKAAEKERKTQNKEKSNKIREPKLRKETPMRTSRHKTAADAITTGTKKKKP